MNNRPQDGEDERRSAPNWLSELARVYGVWHLTVTILQGIVWAGFVAWTESGVDQPWSDTLRVVGSQVWPALTAFSITSVAILVVVQKGGRIVLTFIDERRQRIRKARAEAHEEGRAEGREEGRTEGRAEGRTAGRAEGRTEGRAEGQAATLHALSLDPRTAALLRDDPKIREILRERGIEPPDQRNGDD